MNPMDLQSIVAGARGGGFAEVGPCQPQGDAADHEERPEPGLPAEDRGKPAADRRAHHRGHGHAGGDQGAEKQYAFHASSSVECSCFLASGPSFDPLMPLIRAGAAVPSPGGQVFLQGDDATSRRKDNPPPRRGATSGPGWPM